MVNNLIPILHPLSPPPLMNILASGRKGKPTMPVFRFLLPNSIVAVMRKKSEEGGNRKAHRNGECMTLYTTSLFYPPYSLLIAFDWIEIAYNIGSSSICICYTEFSSCCVFFITVCVHLWHMCVFTLFLTFKHNSSVVSAHLNTWRGATCVKNDTQPTRWDTNR